jgi:hypothetical protein
MDDDDPLGLASLTGLLEGDHAGGVEGVPIHVAEASLKS